MDRCNDQLNSPPPTIQGQPQHYKNCFLNLLVEVNVLGAAGTDGSKGGPESSSSSSDVELESKEELNYKISFIPAINLV